MARVKRETVNATGQYLHESINQVDTNIDNLSGQTFASFLSLSEDLRDTGDFLHNFIHDISGDLAILIGEGQTGDLDATGSYLLDYIDSEDLFLHERVDIVSGDLLSLSGEVDIFKGKSLSTFSKLYLEISGLNSNASGQLKETGSYLLDYIDSEDLFLHERVDIVSGDLLSLSGELDVFKGKALATFF